MTINIPSTAMWDEKYNQKDYFYGRQPSQFLVSQQSYLVPGQRALAIADGEGRNSVFMAENGLQVTAMDSSLVGMRKAQKLAKERRVNIDFQHGDIREWNWTPESYDLVAAIFIQFAEPLLRSRIFAGMIQTLTPGGVLLLHGYTPRQLEYGTGGPPVAELLYTREMLAEAFQEMELLRLEEYDCQLKEGGGHSGMSALIDLIARKAAGRG